MEEIQLIPLIGIFISFGGPLAWSLWKETRYVQRGAAAVYGAASISFGLLYFHNLHYSEIGLAAVIVFGISGGIFWTVAKYSDIWKKPKSLMFSYKSLAGLQFGFLYFAYLVPILGNLPEAVNNPVLNILAWGGGVTLLLFLTIPSIKKIKKKN